MERKKIVHNPLSEREAEILWLAGSGLSGPEISVKLKISQQVIRNNLNAVSGKLVECRIIDEKVLHLPGNWSIRGTTAFAAEAAAEHGLIPPLPEDQKERIEQLKRYHKV